MDDIRPNPQTRIYGDETWTGWWIPPVSVLLVTAVLIIVGAIAQGTGSADAGGAPAGVTVGAGATQP